MALEVNNEQPKIEISCFLSIVVEMVSVVQVLINPTQHVHLSDWIKKMNQSLSKESIDFLETIKALPFQGLEFTEILLNINILDNPDSFLDRLSEFSDTEFIEAMSDHHINQILYKEILNKEVSLNKIPEMIYREHPEELTEVIFNTREFKNNYLRLLKEIKTSIIFTERIKEIENEYIESISTINRQLISNQPLEVSQELMGKKFHKVYDYKKYIFCPSYFLSPVKLRVHNQNMLLILYDLRNTTTNIQKCGDKLSKYLKVISDRTRLEIIRRLSMGPIYGKLLAMSLELTTATISHHLDILRDIDLIKEEKIKNIKYFRLNEDKLQEIITITNKYMTNKL